MPWGRGRWWGAGWGYPFGWGWPSAGPWGWAPPGYAPFGFGYSPQDEREMLSSQLEFLREQMGFLQDRLKPLRSDWQSWSRKKQNPRGKMVGERKSFRSPFFVFL